MTEYIVDFGGSMAMLARIIESQSANLREEIVRCSDCKHFTPVDKEHDNNDWCAKHEHIAWSVNGFCAWAERKEGGRMNGAICFICNELYYSDNETRIHVERIERDGATVKTLRWDGMLCDKCLGRLLGKEGGDD